MSFPALTELEEHLCRYVKGRYFPRHARTPGFTKADLHFFARGVADVSVSFTSERASLPKNYFNRKEFRSGYLLYFVLSNFPKAWNCLEQLDVTKRFGGRDVVRVLDLGSGPGTASLAALEYWKTHAPAARRARGTWGASGADPAQRLEVLAIDQNAEILADARALFVARAHQRATAQTRTVDLGWKNLAQTLRREQFDIVFAMNVLNEFGDLHARQRLVTALLNHHLTTDGVLILIEPGLQRTTRELMELRDMLAPSNIIAPCLHNAPCPMLKHNRRDWCHFYLDWERPKIVADLDQLIGNKKEYLKFSYLILTKSSPSPLIPLPPKGERGRGEGVDCHFYRVVSAPLRSKGKIELLLCPAFGADTSRLHRITRLDKDRSPANADLDCVMRGDIVTCLPTERLATSNLFRLLKRFASR